jgi:hypothetical protein
MKLGRLGVLLVSLLIIQVLLCHNFRVGSTATGTGSPPDVFVGVDVAYENLTATKQLADEISSYANLFIIGCTGVTYSQTQLNDLCQYLYDRGFYFIVYRESAPQTQWLDYAKQEWGDRFLGFYAFDELGGRQLDHAIGYTQVKSATSYADAANQWITSTNGGLRSGPLAFTSNYAYPTEFPLFTADYALYWFDYEAGYDTVFAEFGWNYSRQLNVALCRGAANVQNKDWGVMVLWTYTNPPYIESGPELYNDMVLAYDNGAKYVTVFDSNKDYTQDILGKEQLDAMHQFWQYTQNTPRTSSPDSGRVAYVLPKDYAYGFRGPNDKIWGLWEADNFSYQLSLSLNSALEESGSRLDIIYDDGLQQGNNYGYSSLIYPNNMSLQPTPQPSPSPSQTDQMPTPPNWYPQTPFTSPSPTPAQTQTPSPTQPPSPSPQQKPSPNSQDQPASLTVLSSNLYAIATVVAVAAVATIGLALIKKRSHAL